MLKRYEEYKATSEADWYEKLPVMWDSVKMRKLFKERVEKVSDKNYQALSVGKMGVVPQLETAVKTDNGDNRKLIKNGDFAINSRSDRKGAGGISNYTGSCSLIITVLELPDGLNGNYYHYLLRSSGFSEEFYRNGHGLVSDLWTTKWQEMKNIFVPVPPRQEQDKIAQYLDWKTSEMNRFIHQKKKQIKLLEELKVSEIDKVTKKGLKTSQKLKDSGVQWLGDIPAHWSVLPSKRLFVEGKETRLITDEPCTASQKYGIISQKEYMRRENSRVVIAEQGLEAWKHVNKDDFVISLRSFQGGIEKSDVIGCVTWHYIVLKPNKSVNPSYYKWLLKSKSYISALQATSDFIRDGQDLRYSNFVKVPLLKIPYEEQQQIADYLYQYTKKIDEMISSIQKEISLVEELKVKLVSDVVTGQVDVRDIKIPTYETETDNIESDDDSNEQIFDESIEE